MEGQDENNSYQGSDASKDGKSAELGSKPESRSCLAQCSSPGGSPRSTCHCSNCRLFLVESRGPGLMLLDHGVSIALGY